MIAAGACAFVCILVEGFLVHSHTVRLETAKDRVRHTQQILNMVESSQQTADQIELGTRLYALNQDPRDFDLARDSAARLQGLPRQLQPLITDDGAQALNMELTAHTAELAHEVARFRINGRVPEDALLRCRENLQAMQQEQEKLLGERRARSQKTYASSLRLEAVFVILALLSLAVLFVLLVYDTVRRWREANQVVVVNRELTESVQALEEAALQSRLLTMCSDEIQLCVEAGQVYATSAEYLQRLLPGTTGSLCTINHSRSLLEVVSSWGDQGHGVAETFAPEDCCGLRLGQLRWRRPGSSELDCEHFPAGAPARYFCMPMVAQGETLGVLTVECADEEAYGAVDQRMKKALQMLQLTATAAAALNLRTRLENQAIRDALTGIHNRHFLEVVLRRELARAARHRSPLALLMLDVDHFKRFNDTHGHTAGDTMLKTVAQLLEMNVRTEDTVCRYGGEEFAILLPGITQEFAMQRAEAIREAVARLRVMLANGTTGAGTISIGVAMLSEELAGGEELVARADQALYRAKKAGRNRVMIADAVTVEERAPLG